MEGETAENFTHKKSSTRTK